MSDAHARCGLLLGRMLGVVRYIALAPLSGRTRPNEEQPHES